MTKHLPEQLAARTGRESRDTGMPVPLPVAVALRLHWQRRPVCQSCLAVTCTSVSYTSTLITEVAIPVFLASFLAG